MIFVICNMIFKFQQRRKLGMEWINQFDAFFANSANSLLKSAGSFFTPVFKGITIAGNYGIVFIVIAVILLIFKKTRKAGILALLAMSFGFIFTNLILKNVIARPRPFFDQNSIYYDYWVQAGSLSEKGYSFPSGHATSAAAFAMGLFLAFNKKWSWSFLLIPFLMGYTRIYFFVHYASDIVGGLSVGFSCGALSFLIFWLLDKS